MKYIVTLKESYRPVIKGLVQYQYSSVQLVNKKNGQKCQIKSNFGDNQYPLAEKPTWYFK